MLRPRPARWFEVLVARDDAYLALEALAAAGCVETEWHVGATPASTAADAVFKRYAQLKRRYGPYWPRPRLQLDAARGAPMSTADSAIQALAAWASEAEPTIAALQAALAQDADLALTDEALAALADTDIDVSLLAQAREGLSAALFALPAGTPLSPPDELLVRSADVGTQTLMIAVGPTALVEQFARAVADANGRRAFFPDWLQASVAASRRDIAARRATLQSKAASLRAELDTLAARHALAERLGEVVTALWCLEHGGAIDQDNLGDGERAAQPSQDARVFARITGWTTDAARSISAIENAHARALITFPPPPRGARPPLVLANPWWARPFEIFPRLVGMPGASGADPSTVLAFAVPLMFGYMFGDIGQGLALAVLGLLLARRLPVLRLLIPGGIAAAGFGAVFGSVFCLEDLVHPLWVNPLAQPLPVLAVPIVAGAVLLVLGLLLGWLQASWQGLAWHWLREDGPLVLVYVGLLLALLRAEALWLAAAGVLGSVIGAGAAFEDPLHHTGWQLGKRLNAALAALGELAERLIQLLINTLSFARIGAFALAHAGLSSAVVALAHAADAPLARFAVLLAGNVLILAIEGLVVSIQTTRLVLFEFFTRFFVAEGREFRPLLPPDFAKES